MQDNYNNNFETDDQFYDQAWSNMKGMLDQEMPVSKSTNTKKGGYKKYVFLFLMSLVSFGAGIGSLLLWQQKANPAIPQEQSPKYPIAKQEHQDAEMHMAGSEQIETPTVFTEPKSKALEKPSLSKPLTVRDKTLTKSKQETVSKFSTNFNLLKNTTSEKTSTLPQVSNKNLFSNPIDSDSNISTNNSKTPQTSKILLLASKELTAFEKSDLRPLSLNHAQFQLENKEEKGKAKTKLIIPALKKVQFNWGVMLGWHSEPSKGYGGYTLGFVVDAEVDRKFGIESGLSFSRFQFNDILLNNSPDAFDLNQDEDSGVYGEVIEVPFTPRGDSGSTPVRLGSANYLSIPMLLTYKATRGLRVNMGVEYARMLSASSNKFNESSPDKDYKTSYSFLNPGIYGDLLNKTNFSAIFGLSVQPNEQFGFDLRYNHGFTDLSKNKGQFATQSDTRESLQFSMLYYFGKRK